MRLILYCLFAMQNLSKILKFLPPIALLMLAGCEPSTSVESVEETGPRFIIAGKLESEKLDEASGLQAGRDGVFFLHNDDGNYLFAIDSTGQDLGRMKIKDARNKDWEDITRVMGEDGPLLVIGDTGDNFTTRKKVRLYFVKEPAADDFNEKLKPVHKLDVRYPDGARDVESISYDPQSDMIFLLTKRDVPPRLYGIPMDLALLEKEMDAVYVGEIHPLRPPTRADIFGSPKRGMWVSQPTGLDISEDGRFAAVLTYRSLYVFERKVHETWIDAFQREPAEFIGPPGLHDEAVAFSHDQKSIYVATERRPAPLHRLDLDDEALRAIRREMPEEP
jgi:hypothetical protein